MTLAQSGYGATSHSTQTSLPGRDLIFDSRDDERGMGRSSSSSSSSREEEEATTTTGEEEDEEEGGGSSSDFGGWRGAESSAIIGFVPVDVDYNAQYNCPK